MDEQPMGRPRWFLEAARMGLGSLKYGDLRLSRAILDCPELSAAVGVPVERSQRIYRDRSIFRIFFVNEREVARFDGDPLHPTPHQVCTLDWFKWRVDRVMGKPVEPYYVFGNATNPEGTLWYNALYLLKNVSGETMDLAKRALGCFLDRLPEAFIGAARPVIVRLAWPQPIQYVDYDNGDEIRRYAVECRPLRVAPETEDVDAIVGMFLGHLEYNRAISLFDAKRVPMAQVLVLHIGPVPAPRCFDPITLEMRPRAWIIRAGMLNVDRPT